MSQPAWLITGAATAPPARRPRVEQKSEISAETQKKLLILLSRSVLKHSLDIRGLQSAILRTLLANKDSDLVSAATSATQGHNSKATELRRDNKTKELDNLGEPHVHLWGSIVHHIIEHGKITSAEKEVLSQHLADATPKDLEGKVLVARCKKCYDPRKMMRFVMCVASDTEPILDIVVKAMLAEGAILKRGVAPRTGNDREIQSILDTLVQETS